MKEREIQLRKEVEEGAENPSILKLHQMIEVVCLLYKNDDPGIVVEDENGEIRNITFAWYDKEREMLRLTVGETVFKDEVV